MAHALLGADGRQSDLPAPPPPAGALAARTQAARLRGGAAAPALSGAAQPAQHGAGEPRAGTAADSHPAPTEVLYLHGPGRLDAEVLAHAAIPHRRLDVYPLRGVSPLRLLVNLLHLIRATVQALAAFRAFRPHVVLATGGYVSAPALLAAALQRVPVVLYLPDAVPGWAVRCFAPLARRIALSFPVSRRYFRGAKAVVTGYPVRPEFRRADRKSARRAFGLSPDLPVVLVMGGSSGARSINAAVGEILEPLLHHAQVIHLCGELDEPQLRRQRAALPPAIRQRYHLFRYLHRGIADAMAASDLVVCRAGASVLAELPAMRLPAILIPHPFRRIRQDENADLLVREGAAIKLKDADLPNGVLLPTILSLLNDRATLAAMAAEMGRLARPEAADNIASLVRSVARR